MAEKLFDVQKSNFENIEMQDLSVLMLHNTEIYLKELLVEREKNAALARKNDVLAGLKICTICESDQKEYALVPCGHLLCKSCSIKFFCDEHPTCPFCRTKSTGFLKIYMD
jgi:hypothetical protein